MNSNNAIIEGVKQFARVILAAVLPLIIVGIQSGSVDWKPVITAAIIAALMGVDKFVHKEPTIGGGADKGGLSPF